MRSMPPVASYQRPDLPGNQLNDLMTAVETIRGSGGFTAATAVVLGSGLGNFVSELGQQERIPFNEIPGFPVSTVEGHAGELICGDLRGTKVLVNAGRVHFYEGYSLDEVVFPIRLLAALGVENLIITNAAGSIRKANTPGDLILLTKLLNLTGRSIRADGVEPDEPFSPQLLEIATEQSLDLGLNVHTGTYAGLTGPSYETPAEIRLLRHLGADSVGMSTVHEVIAAHEAGLEILGISCMTNYAAGILDQPLSHQEVIDTGKRVQGEFSELLKRILLAIQG